jgi:TRAP-type C4-dicarboxylate transport system permease small subunit
VAADRLSRIAERLGRAGTAVENGLLVLLLCAMMLLAVGQIVLRLAFNSGLLWADELLKILVLWIALVASVAASRSRRHLRIDLVSRYVPPRYARVPGVIVDAFAASMCGLIAWFSAQYLLLSVGDTVLIDTPAWLAHAVLPVAFLLMCYRFTLHFLTGVLGFFGASSRQAPSA